jgi:hypothetical protein
MKLPGSTLIPCRNQMAPARTKRLATMFSEILIIPPRVRTSEQRPAPAIAAAQLYISEGGQFGLCKKSLGKSWMQSTKYQFPATSTGVGTDLPKSRLRQNYISRDIAEMFCPTRQSERRRASGELARAAWCGRYPAARVRR